GDDQQVPASPHPRGGSTKYLGPGQLHTGMEIRCCDEVERLLRHPSGKVLAHPGHRIRGPGLTSVLDSACDRRGRDVDGGDLPSLLRQPHGVPALTAAEVEGG